jgi:hypothetical protein
VAVEAELTRLRAENARLLKLLRLTPQQAAPPGPAQGAFFEAAPGIVHHRSPQVVLLRCGAGGIRSRFRMRRTVDAPTR